MLRMTNGFHALGKWTFITTACASLSAFYSQTMGEFRHTACRLGIVAGVAAIAWFHARVERARGTSPLFLRYVAVVSVFGIVQVFGSVQVVGLVPWAPEIVSGPTIMVGSGSLMLLERLVEGISGPASGFAVSALVTCVVGGAWALMLAGVAATLHAVGWARDDARRAIRAGAKRRSDARP